MTSARTDWEEVRRRVDAAARALEDGSGFTAADREEILRERARALAAEKSGSVRAATETIQVLQFLLGQESYAVESRHVREVCPLKDLTPLPGLPPFILGIANVRGTVISIIDLGSLFELPRRGIGELDRAIILRNGSMELGVLATAILDTEEMVRADLQAPLPTLSGIRERYLMGIARGRTAVLDASKLLSDTSLVVRQEG